MESLIRWENFLFKAPYANNLNAGNLKSKLKMESLLVKSPTVVKMIKQQNRVRWNKYTQNLTVENTSGEIPCCDRPGTDANNRIIENTSGEITKSYRPDKETTQKLTK